MHGSRTINTFAVATAKSPTSKDEVELLLLTLLFDNPNSEISGGQSSLRIRVKMDDPEFTNS